MTKGLTNTFKSLYQGVRNEMSVRKKIRDLKTDKFRVESAY